MRTRVCITIDTEFSIAGAFSDPSRRPVAEPLVWCDVDGRSEGLGFMLETFKQHKIPATFFVETVHRHYFKHDPMRPIVGRISDDGHEVQLHSHPCWSLFEHADWWDRAHTIARPDAFYGRSVSDSVRLIQQGIDTFRDWGLPAPSAFRSGNLQHDDNLYKALAETGIPYSSNVAVAIFNSGDADYQLYSGRHDRHGVIECPVTTFADWKIGAKRHLKSLTIAGTSFTETRHLLEKAQEAQIPLVVLLTHPFEYVHTRDLNGQQTRRHGLTQDRLGKLCKFLDGNRDKFAPAGLAEAARACNPDERNTLLDGALWHSVPRMAAQVAHEKVGRWALNNKYKHL